jgi:uncharacterized protein HemX
MKSVTIKINRAMTSNNHECKREGEISQFVKQMDNLTNRFEEMEKENSSKVSWTVFWSIIILIIGIGTTVFNKIEADESAETASLQQQIKDVEREDAVMNNKINDGDKLQVKIETQLTAIQASIAELNVKVSGNSGQLKQLNSK